MIWKSLNLSDGALDALSFVMHNKYSTKQDVSKFLDKGNSTVNRYILELYEKGIIKEFGTADSTGGRKPTMYVLSSDFAYIACINISTIYCEVAIIDFAFNVLSIKSFSITDASKPDEVIRATGELFNEMKDELSLDHEKFLGAGVSVYGALRNSDGVLYPPIIQYMNEEWIDYPILKNLYQYIKLPLYADKGINCAASYEYNYGDTKCDSIIYVLCAMNIRSTIIQNGVVVDKSSFAEDAFGHMVINYDGPKCQCGQYGCVDCYATIPSIISDFKKQVKLGIPTLIDTPIDMVTIGEICSAADNGDNAAIMAIRAKASMLGIALANYINIVCPDKVILSGLLIKKSKLYYDTAVEMAKQRLFITKYKDIQFEPKINYASSLTIGSGAMLVEKLTQNIESTYSE